MTNGFFNANSELVRHTLGRAEAVMALFEGVEAGFDKLPTELQVKLGTLAYAGSSTGSASAYACTLWASAITAYADGMAFAFKANHTNTGAATLNLNGIGGVPLKDAYGAPLGAGAITSGTFVKVRYHSGDVGFRLDADYSSDAASAASSAIAAAASAAAAAVSATAAGLSADTATALALGYKVVELYAADPSTVGLGNATIDTAALKAACTAAGRNGVVWTAKALTLNSQTGYLEARREGPGTITVAGKTIAFRTGQIRTNRTATAWKTGTTISSTDYSHFPVGQVLPNGNPVMTFYRGRNHGQADDEAVCASQAKASSGALIINGNEASGGLVTGIGATTVTITSSGNDSGITVTITGKNAAGGAQVVATAGPNTTSKTTTEEWTEISAVTVSGAVAGTIKLGLSEVANDLVAATSLDGGKSWVNTTIGDGRTAKDKRFYYNAAAVTADGLFLAFHVRLDIAGAAPYPVVRQASWDGLLWSDEVTVTFSGITPPTTHAPYGQVATLPSGKLVMSSYSGAKNYVSTSTDNGLTFAGVEVADTTTYLRLEFSASTGTFQIGETVSVAAGDPDGAGPLGVDGGGTATVIAWDATSRYLWVNGVTGTFLNTSYPSLSNVVPATAIDGRTVVGSTSGATGTPSAGRVFDWQMSEAAIVPYDEDTWWLFCRVDGLTSRGQVYKTTDTGATWTSMGQTNININGGHVAPAVVTTWIGGELWLIMTWGQRDSSTGSTDEPNPDTQLVWGCRAAAALTTMQQWSSEAIAANFSVAGSTMRSGYATPFINPVTQQLLLAYGEETTARLAQIKTVTFDWKRVAQNLRIGGLTFDGSNKIYQRKNYSVFTPTVMSSGGGTATYTTQYGRRALADEVEAINAHLVLNSIAGLTAGNVSIDTGLAEIAATANTENLWALGIGLNSSLRIYGRVRTGTSIIDLYVDDNAGTRLTVANLANGCTLSIRGEFFTQSLV